MRERWTGFGTPSLPTVAPGQTVSSAGLVSLLAVVALGLAVVSGAPLAALAIVVASGVAVALGQRWLAAQHPLLLLLGGVVVPLAVAGVFAGAALGIVSAGVLPGTAFTIAGLATGLGWGGLLTGGLVDDRPRTAAVRYWLAFFALAAIGVVALVVMGELFPSIAGVVPALVAVVINSVITTGDPLATAGPTLLVFAVGFAALRRACADLTVPYLFTDVTRARLGVVVDRLWRIALAGTVITGALGTLVLAATVGWGLTTLPRGSAIRTVVSFLGRSGFRWLALALVAVCIAVIVVRLLRRLATRAALAELTTAVFTLLGLGAAATVLVFGVTETGVLAALSQVEIVTSLLGGTGGVVVAAALAGAVLLAGAVVLLKLRTIHTRLPEWEPAAGMLGAGLAVLPIAVVLAGGRPVLVLALIVLAVLVVDMTRFGASMAVEVGRRNSFGTELVHGATGTGVGAVGFLVAWWFVVREPLTVPTMSTTATVVGIGAFVGVLVLLVRQLSA